MLNRIRSLAKTFGIYKVAHLIINSQGNYKPLWQVTRNNITYELDLRQTIDFTIFMGGWEKETLRVLRKELHPRDVVIEVGANVGAHTLLMASLVGPAGKVIAVEPTRFARTKLQNNLRLNPGLSNVTVVSAVVSNHDLATPKLEINSSWSVDGKQAPEALHQAR